MKINKDILVGWAILAVVVTSTSFLGLYMSKYIKDNDSIQREKQNQTNQINSQLDQINKQVTDLKQQVETLDYNKKDTMKKVVLFSDSRNTAINEKQTQTFERKILMNGDISNGYLYVKASVNDKKLSKDESVYVKLISTINNTHQEVGGHLRKDKSLDVPLSNDYTELLYKLNEVYYKVSIPYSETVNVESADFSRILNEGSSTKIISFSSTIKTGNIKEMSFYYTCMDGVDCSVSVE